MLQSSVLFVIFFGIGVQKAKEHALALILARYVCLEMYGMHSGHLHTINSTTMQQVSELDLSKKKIDLKALKALTRKGAR